jgi:hypothetical protein
MSDAQTLLDLKEKIETGKVKRNKLEGQKEEALSTLKKEFKCKSVKEGKKLLKEMQEEVEKDSNVLEVQIEKLEEKCK